MEMINVCIYADTTGLFSESECISDNLIDMDFPLWIVVKWYDAHPEFRQETAGELKKEIDNVTFFDWLNEVSWAGDTDGLFDFSIMHGYTPTLGDNTHTYVFYRDDCNFKTVVFTGTVDECRKFGKENDWELDGNELEVAY